MLGPIALLDAADGAGALATSVALKIVADTVAGGFPVLLITDRYNEMWFVKRFAEMGMEASGSMVHISVRPQSPRLADALLGLPLDAGLVREKALEIGAALVVFDRFPTFWEGEGNGRASSEAYRGMAALVRLTEATEAGVLLVADAKKRAVTPTDGIMGGRAIAEAVTTVDRVYALDRGTVCRLAQVKNDLRKLSPTLKLTPEEEHLGGVVAIGEAVPETAADLHGGWRSSMARNALRSSVRDCVKRAALKNGGGTLRRGAQVSDARAMQLNDDKEYGQRSRRGIRAGRRWDRLAIPATGARAGVAAATKAWLARTRCYLPH
ncbi:MAG: hypothetical protein R2909_16905 [Gemmatimonadales bacterium]